MYTQTYRHMVKVDLVLLYIYYRYRPRGYYIPGQVHKTYDAMLSMMDQ